MRQWDLPSYLIVRVQRNLLVVLLFFFLLVLMSPAFRQPKRGIPGMLSSIHRDSDYLNLARPGIRNFWLWTVLCGLVVE